MVRLRQRSSGCPNARFRRCHRRRYHQQTGGASANPCSRLRPRRRGMKFLLVIAFALPLAMQTKARQTKAPTTRTTSRRFSIRTARPCHRPGESGPFSLLTYQDAKRHARQIAAVTRAVTCRPGCRSRVTAISPASAGLPIRRSNHLRLGEYECPGRSGPRVPSATALYKRLAARTTGPHPRGIPPINLIGLRTQRLLELYLIIRK